MTVAISHEAQDTGIGNCDFVTPELGHVAMQFKAHGPGNSKQHNNADSNDGKTAAIRGIELDFSYRVFSPKALINNQLNCPNTPVAIGMFSMPLYGGKKPAEQGEKTRKSRAGTLGADQDQNRIIENLVEIKNHTGQVKT